MEFIDNESSFKGYCEQPTIIVMIVACTRLQACERDSQSTQRRAYSPTCAGLVHPVYVCGCNRCELFRTRYPARPPQYRGRALAVGRCYNRAAVLIRCSDRTIRLIQTGNKMRSCLAVIDEAIDFIKRETTLASGGP